MGGWRCQGCYHILRLTDGSPIIVEFVRASVGGHLPKVRISSGMILMQSDKQADSFESKLMQSDKQTDSLSQNCWTNMNGQLNWWAMTLTDRRAQYT